MLAIVVTTSNVSCGCARDLLLTDNFQQPVYTASLVSLWWAMHVSGALIPHSLRNVFKFHTSVYHLLVSLVCITSNALTFGITVLLPVQCDGRLPVLVIIAAIISKKPTFTGRL